MFRLWRLVLAVLLVAPAASAFAQEVERAPAPRSERAPAAQSERAPFRQEELEALLASIALYPDPLLSQVLMAATYPIEIVEADRWVKQNAQLQGEELAQALEGKRWDASVKSLTNFPDVLSMMSEELEWTVKLGDAFLGQQEQVMSTIQILRARAKERGNLKSTEQQTVTVQPAEDPGEQIIVIQPAEPDVIYVPAYDPWVTFGYWPYPSYTPYYYPWPWFWGGAGLSFGVGVGLGYGWGYAWGYPDWHHHHVYVDHHRHVHRNRFIHRDRYLPHGAGRRGPQRWTHQPVHRQGLAYRNRAVADRYQGRQWTTGTLRAREAFRGRAEEGRRAISSGAVDRAGTAGPRRSQLTSAPLGSRSITTTPRGSAQPRSTGGTIRRGGALGASSDLMRIPTRASSERGHSSRVYSGQGRSFSSPSFSAPRSSGGTIRSVRPGGATFRGVSPGGSTFRGVSPGGSTFRGVRPGGSTFRGGSPTFRGGGGSTFRGGGSPTFRGGGGPTFRGGGGFRGGGVRGGGGFRGGGGRGGGGRR